MPHPSRVAVVTGASRGIGRGCAIELAKAGFAVVLCARTLREGQRFEHSSTLKWSDTSPLPGSLESVAAEIGALGGEALPLKLDLNVPEDIEAVAAQTLDTFGRLDVLVNNGRYIGPGHMDAFLDTPLSIFEAHDRCNVLAPLHLIQRFLPVMIAQGGGIIFQITSASGWNETPKLPGQGGWGLGYSLSKAAFNRIAPGLAKELKPHNIAVINLEPGNVGTERRAQDLGAFGLTMDSVLPVEVPGLALAHLATHRYPMFFSGRTIPAYEYVISHQLIDLHRLPAPYGPAAWGLPQPFKWLGG